MCFSLISFSYFAAGTKRVRLSPHKVSFAKPGKGYTAWVRWVRSARVFLPSPPAPLPRCGRGVCRTLTCLEC